MASSSASIPNRIEVEERAGFKRKSDTILLGSVSSVATMGMGGAKLQLTTTGGDHEYTIGKRSAEARAAILRHL